jgi:proteasome lid subunit RPN8/RPN11
MAAPAERRDVISALRRHGISGAVAAILWTAAADLRRRTRRRGIEHAVTLDAATGQPVGPMLTGSRSSTDLTLHLRALRPGHEYIQLHTHPGSTSFSDLDVRLLAEYPAIHAMIVVGENGTWYVISRQPGISILDSRAVFYDFVRELQRLGQDQIPAAARPHQATERIAANYGLLYDRLIGSTDE